ncbi:MAG: VWA domain-containing protein [Candidatus Sericytochromatia bacterium]|nr:VWA domain-containing protein [Candidatus Sericytochromatia bacterium]
MRQRRRHPLALFALLALLSGCVAGTPTPGVGRVGPMGGRIGGAMPAAAAMAAGVNVGGAQDIKLAREVIAKGGVPRAEQLQLQGLYAEHDLPLGEAPAGKLLHLTLGLGIAPALPEGKPAHWVQVGLGTGLSAEQLARPPLQLVVVADQSGSMGGPKMEALREALKQLVDKLDERDQLGIVLFDDDTRVEKPLGPLGDKAKLKAQIAGFQVDGGTDINRGLKAGRALFEALQAKAGMQRRILLLTDAVPTLGPKDPESFAGLISRYAEEGIGLTAFGIGLDFGAELGETIGNQKGGNYVFLRDEADVREVFAEDFDFLMTPVAHDFSLAVRPGQGFKLTHAYGVSEVAEAKGDYSLKVKSLFFSKHRGAIVLRFEELTPGAGGGGAVVAKGKLSYTPATGGAAVSEALVAAAPAVAPRTPGEATFAPAPARKAVALTNMGLGLAAALRAHEARNKPEAARLLEAVQGELEAARKALQDEALAPEVALVEQLRANMGLGRGAQASGTVAVTPPASASVPAPAPRGGATVVTPPAALGSGAGTR